MLMRFSFRSLVKTFNNSLLYRASSIAPLCPQQVANMATFRLCPPSANLFPWRVCVDFPVLTLCKACVC
ncbi:unnamed protein product [Closterium sp. Naga37s-1]|nr:unnamed protein product [Closterium sp. Naga37s-1]